MFRGWYQVAFTRELTDDLTPVTVGQLPLVLVRSSDGIQAFDAICPHRGAHLGYGGRLVRAGIVCPFHGHRIALGADAKARYSVRRYHTLEIGGLVFVLLAEEHENGLAAYLQRLTRTHCFVPGFQLRLGITPDYVVENAFDGDHFKAVHGISRRPTLQLRHSEHGELAVESTFYTDRPSLWRAPAGAGGPDGDLPSGQQGSVQLRFFARAFSPSLIATELGEEGHSHVVITAATLTPEGESVVRVSAVVPLLPNGEPPNSDLVRHLLLDSKKAFEQDVVVWEHLDRHSLSRYAPGDRPVIEFRKFCLRFLTEEPV
jgi:3-ketosteroid 9alpha-monooxygenase subunit A